MAAILIYDEGCPYCELIAKTVNLSQRFDILPYGSDHAKKLLEDEFDDPGFTFYLFEEDKIYFGDRAAERTAGKFYRSKIAGKFFLKSYPYLSRFFSILSRRTGIRQPECSDGKCIMKSGSGGVAERSS